MNNEFSQQLWIGALREGGYNYCIKGFLDDDYENKIKACDVFMEELKQIKEFYQRLVNERSEK